MGRGALTAGLNRTTQQPEDIYSQDGAQEVINRSPVAGEEINFDRMVNMEVLELDDAAVTNDGYAFSGAPAAYGGYLVTVATASASILVRRGGPSGDVLDTINSGTAQWSKVMNAKMIYCPDGIYLDFTSTATGSIKIMGARSS